MKVAVAMSGGVDSSTAAYLLRSEGHDVIGMSMQMYNALDRSETTSYGGCCTLDDLADARRVAWKLQIPYFVLNMEADFREAVIRPFVSDYLSGKTPSPCVLCNTHVKFALMHNKAFAVGADKVATGHYARITRSADGKYELRKARDLSKDQSYFLFELSQEQLSHTLFPLGEFTKKDVRRIAASAALPVAEKSESFEICFVPNALGYAKVVEEEARKLLDSRPDLDDQSLRSAAAGAAGGEIMDVSGRVVGRHEGYYNFTIGQRRGLQIGGLPERIYVLDVDPATRRVTVGPGELLERNQLTAERVHWISGQSPRGPVHVTARVRSRQNEIAALVTPLEGNRAQVEFSAPLRAVAPGQAVVFYRDDLCLGGGWITRPAARLGDWATGRLGAVASVSA